MDIDTHRQRTPCEDTGAQKQRETALGGRRQRLERGCQKPRNTRPPGAGGGQDSSPGVLRESMAGILQGRAGEDLAHSGYSKQLGRSETCTVQKSLALRLSPIRLCIPAPADYGPAGLLAGPWRSAAPSQTKLLLTLSPNTAATTYEVLGRAGHWVGQFGHTLLYSVPHYHYHSAAGRYSGWGSGAQVGRGETATS